MCGICGWIDSKPVDRAILTKMTLFLCHRGPDHHATYVRDEIGFGHTRLSILDLSALGNQPMHSDDGSVSITFNGEFYDFNKFRDQLIADGHRFRSHSDTEVIVHLYQRFGISFVEKLRGMFALAIWDQKSKELFLVRDRVGKKPLYYCHSDHRLLFASRLKSILLHPGVSREIDPVALDTYFRLGYIPKSHCIIKGLCKLPAGHFLRYKDGKIEIKRYWDIPGDDQIDPYVDLPEAAVELSRLLKESVSLRLVSDVPIGVLLSGGTDSSVIAALAMQSSNSRLKTFSVGFDEQDFNELPYARSIAKHIGSEHFEQVVRLDDMNAIGTLSSFFDEPFADPSVLPTYLISRMARDQVKVVLSGDGGDELFGGYNWYNWVLRHNQFTIIPRIVRQLTSRLANAPRAAYPGKHFLGSLDLDEYNCFLERTSVFLGDEISHVLAGSVLNPVAQQYEADYRRAGTDILSRLSRHDFHYYLTDDILTKVDSASMAVALEVRTPLLDHKVCEFAFKLANNLKISGGQSKVVFRKVAKSILPRSFDFDRKHGFVIPLSEWMAGTLGYRLEDVLESANYNGLLNKHGIRLLLKDHRRSSADNGKKLWSVFMFCHWMLALGAA